MATTLLITLLIPLGYSGCYYCVMIVLTVFHPVSEAWCLEMHTWGTAGTSMQL
jgi:hypothetical protein